jgi:predicted Zn-dependent peptidase
VQDVEEHLARLRAVTPEDVHRVAKDVLGGPRSLVAVGPFDELPG